ncbi:hypothetical protein GOV13_03290 [Candidatus Pacearchaeota archaeon]|nr:hypothetical protein [Candidatus Pacearchaeota archaeon]
MKKLFDAIDYVSRRFKKQTPEDIQHQRDLELIKEHDKRKPVAPFYRHYRPYGHFGVITLEVAEANRRVCDKLHQRIIGGPLYPD